MFAIINIKYMIKKNNKGLNILILHAYWECRGSESAVRAMIDSLRYKLPVKKMKIMIMRKEITQFPYNNIEIIKPYPYFKNKQSELAAVTGNYPSLSHEDIIIILLDFLLILLSFGKLSFTKTGREFLKSIKEADIVIHAPDGPFIGDIYRSRAIVNLDFLHLWRLLIVKILKKKPIFFYAPSVGPFQGKIKNLLRKFILKKIDLIIIREPISAEYLKTQLGLESFVTSDSALQNDIPKNYLTKYDDLSNILRILKNKKTIGIVVTDLLWHPIYRNYPKLALNIKNHWLITTDYLIKKGYQILLIPQWINEIKTNEMSLLKDISNLNQERIFILPSNIDSFGQQIIISKLFCLISMRYHPSLWAIKMNVPFITISYEHKFMGFIKKTELFDYIINTEEMNADKIIDKFNTLEKNYIKIKDRLKNISQFLKKDSKKTNELIIDKLIKLGWKNFNN